GKSSPSDARNGRKKRKPFAAVKAGQTVVRQIICTYILHIKCACISDGMDKHSKFLHLFAQLI
ncbi:MAG: hypothetical protein K1W28_12890, partial [Lachnospiraceae bacterium]